MNDTVRSDQRFSRAGRDDSRERDRGRHHHSRRGRDDRDERDEHGGRDDAKRQRRDGDGHDRHDHRERRDRYERHYRRSRSPRRRHRGEGNAERGDDGARRGRTHSERDRVRDRDRDGRSRSLDDRRRRRHDRHAEDEQRRHDRHTEEDDSGQGLPKRPVQRGGPLPDQADSFALVQAGGDGDAEGGVPAKERPNLQTTGVLAAASHAVVHADGAVTALKYHEPPEARKPTAAEDWRLFIFKDGRLVEEDGAGGIAIGERSCWLLGRDAAVVDLVAAHPSVSGQHAVVQFRFVERRNEYGERLGRVRPYLLDLASANGTRLNHAAVAAQRYVELRDGDVLTFGQSTREYVVVRGKKNKKP